MSSGTGGRGAGARSARGAATPADVVVHMVRRGLVVLLLLLPAACATGRIVAGWPGFWGALLGLALPALVLGVTLLAALLTRRSRPEVLAAAVLGSYLLKLVLVIAVLAVLRAADFYDRPVLGVTALVGLAVALVAEAAAVVRAKVPYVDPAPRADAPDGRGLST